MYSQKRPRNLDLNSTKAKVEALSSPTIRSPDRTKPNMRLYDDHP